MKSRSFIIASISLLATSCVKSEKPVSMVGKDKIMTVEDVSLRSSISIIPRKINKYACDHSSCKLDLSLIDIKEDKITVEVGLLETNTKTFKRKGISAMEGHWYGESGFSYLNLLKKVIGPSGHALWFGILFNDEDDTYYDISPNANATSIVSQGKLGSELRPDLYVEQKDYPTMFSITTAANVSKVGDQTTLADDGSVIDIMMVWTSGAECQASSLASDCVLTSLTETNMRGKIDSMISLSNQVYINSNIFTKLKLVYAYRDSDYKWDYLNNCEDAIDHLGKKGDGYMDDVHEKRSKYKADLVQLITVPCSYCGIGYLGIPLRADAAFSVITTDCMSLSSPHELGHNMGCYHDRATDNKCSNSGFYFGYKDPDHAFTDVMAYDCIPEYCLCPYNCGSSTSRCIRAPYISNVVTLYSGFPIGNTDNNCAQTINDNRKVIASYYQSTDVPAGSPVQPRAPNSVPAPQQNCTHTCQHTECVCF